MRWLRGGPAPWVIAAGALLAGGLAALPFLGADFYRALVATYIGAVIGFMVALYVDRLQRSEDEAARRERVAEAQEREEARQDAVARERRVAVISLLREELGRIPDQMVPRQNRNYPPTDVMSDIMWRSLSSSGELRWIVDLELLRKIASAYDLLGLEIDLERQWMQSRTASGGGPSDSSTDRAFANHLILSDSRTWRAVCDACRAMDVALSSDGAPPGSNADRLFCP